MKQTLYLAAVPAVLLALASSSAAAVRPPIQQLFASARNPATYSCANGYNSNSLLQPAEENSYGTTEFGGTGNAATGTVFNLYGRTIGAGSVKTALFRLTFAGEFDTLGTCIDRQSPSPSAKTANGKLYGVMSVNRAAPGTFGSTAWDMNTPPSMSEGVLWGSKLVGGRSDCPNDARFSYLEKSKVLNTVQFAGAEQNESIRQYRNRAVE